MLVIGIAASAADLCPRRCWCAARRWCSTSRRPSPASRRRCGAGADPRMSAGRGVAHAAVHRAGAGSLRLLRGAFRPDLPHGEPTPSAAASRRWRRSASTAWPACRAWAAACCWACWPTGWAPSRCWSAACWCRRWAPAPISSSASSASSTRSSIVFGIAYGGVMPLYAILAREYFGDAHHGHGVRRDLGAGEPRHGVRPVGRRLGVRHLRELLAGSISARSRVGLAAVAVALTFRPIPAAAKLRAAT